MMKGQLRFLCKGTGLAAALMLWSPWLSAQSGSLWKDDSSTSMYADKRARAVGDILTILVQENSSSAKSQTTQTSKKSSIDASIEQFLYSPNASSLLTKKGSLPGLKVALNDAFDGGGKINNSEKITSRIAVQVVDVLPNGQLVVEGRKNTSFSKEKMEAVLRGVVRPEDVTANNTVFSYHLAEASIQYLSKGVITDSQKKGWFRRIWEKVNPF